MPIDAFSVLCAQLTCDLLAIAKFLFTLIFAVFFYSFIVILSHLRFCDNAFENAIRFNTCCSTPNFVKIQQYFHWDNGNLTILKTAAVRHFGFWKFAVFVMRPLSACRSASANKISPKSDSRSMSYGQKSDFQDGGRHHLEFQKFQFLVTWL